MIQIEHVDDVCIICDVRHTPRWLERAMAADPGLDRMMRPRTWNPQWLNIHLFTKRAFVSQEQYDKTR